MDAVAALQEYGYKFYVVDGKIKYYFTGLTKPDKNTIVQLFEQIKTSKAAAITYIEGQATSEKQPTKIYQIAEEVIKAVYNETYRQLLNISIRGLYAHFRD